MDGLAFPLLLVVIAVLYVLTYIAGHNALANLKLIEDIETMLPLQQLRDVVSRAMKGRVPAFAEIAEGADYIERTFRSVRRGKTYTIVLRAELSEADRPAVYQVRVGVTSLEYSSWFGAPIVGNKRPARTRRKVIRAVLEADPAAKTSSAFIVEDSQ